MPLRNNQPSATQVRKMAYLAMLVAMASAVHYLESLLPPLFPFAPGAKLGLANVFTLFALLKISNRDALAVTVLRCLVGMLITGSVTGFFYAISGGILSFFAMVGAKRLFQDQVSPYGLSIAGATFHNIGQVFLACALTQSLYILSYLPILIAIAIPVGFFTGALCRLCIRSFEKAGVML